MDNKKRKYTLTNDYIFKKVFAKDENNGEFGVKIDFGHESVEMV